MIESNTCPHDSTAGDGYVITGEPEDGVFVNVIIANGATVTLDNVTIGGTAPEDAWNYTHDWAGITCAGNATIILKEGTENTVKGFHTERPGIYVPAGSTLTIGGTGKLEASCNRDDYNGYAAGIGGGNSEENDGSCGNIVILGGEITATGGIDGAGSGSGNGGPCGNITISGGTVTATGGEYAAGIGAGGGAYNHTGTITISGGTVTATGGEWGAGIGGSNDDDEYSEYEGSYPGDIVITGGVVIARGGQYAAGIGPKAYDKCGEITISSDITSVTAIRGEGYEEYPIAPIGISIEGTCGTVTIDGTTEWSAGTETTNLNFNVSTTTY